MVGRLGDVVPHHDLPGRPALDVLILQHTEANVLAAPSVGGFIARSESLDSRDQHLLECARLLQPGCLTATPTVALLSERVTGQRLRAVLFVELAEHADLKGKAAVEQRLRAVDQVQFCFEVTGECDLLVLVDCANMMEFNRFCDDVLVADPAVRRYETSFVKREVKFAPFVNLTAV